MDLGSILEGVYESEKPKHEFTVYRVGSNPGELTWKNAADIDAMPRLIALRLMKVGDADSKDRRMGGLLVTRYDIKYYADFGKYVMYDGLKSQEHEFQVGTNWKIGRKKASGGFWYSFQTPAPFTYETRKSKPISDFLKLIEDEDKHMLGVGEKEAYSSDGFYFERKYKPAIKRELKKL
jgi:hypothetical protein